MSAIEANSPLISPRNIDEDMPCRCWPWRVQSKQRYSLNGLTAAEKLARQLFCAMHDNYGEKKVEVAPFVIQASSDSLFQIENDPFVAGVEQHIGSREKQEDRFLANGEVHFECGEQKWKGLLFGVFDGCGDDGTVGEYLKLQMGPTLAKVLNRLLKDSSIVSDEIVTNAFTETFHLLSRSCRKAKLINGATAACAFVVGKKIYFPNVGDSRVILVKSQATYQLTEDAKILNPRFQRWHENAGNELAWDNTTLRVGPQGELRYVGRNIAREIGSSTWMCSRPKITRIYLERRKDNLKNGWIFCNRGDYLVLATNGLYQAATLEEVGDAVRNLAAAGTPPERMAMQLANRAGSCADNDNVTVMVIPL